MTYRCSVMAQLLASGIFLTGAHLNAQMPALGDKPFVGWGTNGPGVFRLYLQSTQVLPGPPVSLQKPPEDLPMEVRRGMLIFPASMNVTIITNTVSVFDHYLPESLNNLVWTNFIANTNGKSMSIWTVRQRTSNWPASPAIVRWNPNSLIWGMKGLTAICPCWSGEGPPGWIPITALTRRHGYLLGHGMKTDGLSTEFAGKKVWFLTTENRIVEVNILRQLSRLRDISHRDYTIVLFDADLPTSIEPMRVVHANDVFGVPKTKYCDCAGAPRLLFETEQKGNVSTEVPGFTVDTMKGGDSGSPNMLPLPGELAFWSGRTTSPPSPEMQADMDQLCKTEGLDPAKYQMQYVDLSNYPTY